MIVAAEIDFLSVKTEGLPLLHVIGIRSSQSPLSSNKNYIPKCCINLELRVRTVQNFDVFPLQVAKHGLRVHRRRS